MEPTVKPSSDPSIRPTKLPLKRPTMQLSPTRHPTKRPSKSPTKPHPTKHPTKLPTKYPAQKKCLWAQGCSSSIECEEGSYCQIFPGWSQCQEDKHLSTSHCYVTNNGPYSGQRWGCSKDLDCCNPAAICGSDRLCNLSCNLSL